MRGWNGIKPAGKVELDEEGNRVYQVGPASEAEDCRWAVLASLCIGQGLKVCGCTTSRGDADDMAQFWRDRGTAALVLPLMTKED